jgi:hypothetical protein
MILWPPVAPWEPVTSVVYWWPPEWLATITAPQTLGRW